MSVTPVIGASTTGQSIRSGPIAIGLSAGGVGSEVIGRVCLKIGQRIVDCGCDRKALAPATAMSAPSPARFAAVIVAAGQGLRAGQPVPKQFASWRGKPVVRHAAEALIAAGSGPLAVAIPEGAAAIAGEALAGLPGVRLVTGGATRQASVRAALVALEADAPDFVLIHDAARTHCPAGVIARLLGALGEWPGAVPVLPVVDSLAFAEDGVMAGSADREA